MIGLGKYDDLAQLIVKYIQEEFAKKHLSGNLVNTIRIEQGEDSVRIIIPAQKYDVYKYIHEHHSIVYTNEGSYASDVDIRGGFSGEHIGYAEKAIKKAIDAWLKAEGIKGKVE